MIVIEIHVFYEEWVVYLVLFVDVLEMVECVFEQTVSTLVNENDSLLLYWVETLLENRNEFKTDVDE
jgi:hypothetical protein